MNEPLLTTIQTAHVLGLHPDTLRAWRKREIGPMWVRVGSRYRYRREAIDDFLAGRQQKPSDVTSH